MPIIIRSAGSAATLKRDFSGPLTAGELRGVLGSYVSVVVTVPGVLPRLLVHGDPARCQLSALNVLASLIAGFPVLGDAVLLDPGDRAE